MGFRNLKKKVEEEGKREKEQPPKGKTRELIETVVIALGLALILRAFLVQSFMIPTPSMVPTLKVGDHILVNKYVYGWKMPWSEKRVLPFWDPQRWDVVVFAYPPQPQIDYVKRVVALAGETVEVRSRVLYIDGKPIEDARAWHDPEKGPPAGIPRRDDFGPFLVPPGHVFVMGDNRENSADSRFWGPVPLKNLKGKAMVIYWSANLDRPWLPLPASWSWKDPSRTPPLVPALLLFVPEFSRFGRIVR